MITADERRLGWQKITVLRDLRDRSQFPKLMTSTEFAILCFIEHQSGNATISQMVSHPFFINVSHSTIKRAVLALSYERLISSIEGADRRERYLSTNGEQNEET
mgnify:CR=1 FL=1